VNHKKAKDFTKKEDWRVRQINNKCRRRVAIITEQRRAEQRRDEMRSHKVHVFK
jgi:hypothetical protein